MTELTNPVDVGSQLIDVISRTEQTFSTITTDNIALIVAGLDEIERANQSFGKKDSQTFSKLTSLTMVASSPYGRLKQCLAIIEKKRSALRDNVFILKKQMNKLRRLRVDLTKVTDDEYSDINKEKIQIEIDEINCNMSSSVLYIEGAIKELGSYQDAYNQIKENYKIPDDWDEEHYELHEVQEHIRLAVNHSVRDVIMTGRINVGTQEYLEQFGLNPLAVLKLIIPYIEENMKEDTVPTINTLHKFLDFMAEQFSEEYKKCVGRIGLTELLTKGLLYDGKA